METSRSKDSHEVSCPPRDHSITWGEPARTAKEKDAEKQLEQGENLAKGSGKSESTNTHLNFPQRMGNALAGLRTRPPFQSINNLYFLLSIFLTVFCREGKSINIFLRKTEF